MYQTRKREDTRTVTPGERWDGQWTLPPWLQEHQKRRRESAKRLRDLTRKVELGRRTECVGVGPSNGVRRSSTPLKKKRISGEEVPHNRRVISQQRLVDLTPGVSDWTLRHEPKDTPHPRALSPAGRYRDGSDTTNFANGVPFAYTRPRRDVPGSPKQKSED